VTLTAQFDDGPEGRINSSPAKHVRRSMTIPARRRVSLSTFAVYLLFCSYFANAQQPKALKEVRSIRIIESPEDSKAMDGALIRHLRQAGAFQLAFDASDTIDSILLPIYGCSTKTGEYFSAKERLTKRGLCTVSLIDPHAEDRDGIPIKIWEVPRWKVTELYAEIDLKEEAGQPVTDIQDTVAHGVIEDLLSDRKLSVDGKVAEQPRSLPLGQVRTIFISMGDYSYETPADKLLEQEMFKWLVKWYGKKFHGDCITGWESIMPEVRLVCFPGQADAILVGPYTEAHTVDFSFRCREANCSGSAQQRTVDTGIVELWDQRTGKTIWSTTKSDYQWLGGHHGGPGALVEKAAKQLIKDHAKSERQVPEKMRR